MIEQAKGRDRFRQFRDIRDRVIRFRVTAEEQVAITDAAARGGKSISQYIREAINLHESY